MMEKLEIMFNENFFLPDENEKEIPEFKRKDLHSYEFVAFKPEHIPDELSKQNKGYYIDLDDLINYSETNNKHYYTLLPLDYYEANETVKKIIDEYKKEVFVLFYNIEFFKDLIANKFKISKDKFQISKKTDFLEFYGHLVDALRVKNLNEYISSDINLYSSNIVDVYLILHKYKKYIITLSKGDFDKKILLTDPIFTYEFTSFLMADEFFVKYYYSNEQGFNLLFDKFKQKVIYTKDEFINFYFEFSNKTKSNVLKTFFNKLNQTNPDTLVYIRPILNDEAE